MWKVCANIGSTCHLSFSNAIRLPFMLQEGPKNWSMESDIVCYLTPLFPPSSPGVCNVMLGGRVPMF